MSLLYYRDFLKETNQSINQSINCSLQNLPKVVIEGTETNGTSRFAPNLGTKDAWF